MREINRYPVEGEAVVLVHVQDGDGDEEVWIVHDPSDEPFYPHHYAECFIIASSDDQFKGLTSLSSAISKCMRAIGDKVSPEVLGSV